MKRIKTLLVCILSLVLITSCNSKKMKSSNKVSIIPLPKELKMLNGSFKINAKTKIVGVSLDEKQKQVVDLFSKQLATLTDLKLSVNDNSDAEKSSKAIIFSIDSSINNIEGYSLLVNKKTVNIKSGTSAGLFYGAQSLLQLIPVKKETTYSIPALEIQDEPRFTWRGLHLDVSRHFFPIEDIKEFIDLMATFKLNTFHWHLVDDQGWRIEIKKYPKLTDISAWRLDDGKKEWGYSSQPAVEGKPKYGGFYTQEEVKEIIQYAALRNVTIVPEIEMPGHAKEMVFAYPELSCKVKGKSNSSFSPSLCAGNEKTFEIIEGILSEIIDLFPSQYIHIGGDEANKDFWKTCPKCQQRVKDEGLKNVEELQSYFIKRIEKFVISKGRKIIGWDEILEGGLPPEAAVMSWRGEVGGIKAAQEGHNVVMTPTTYCYFDYFQSLDMDEPKAIGGFIPLEKVYNYEPVPKELTPEQSKLVLGAQGNVWTEHMFTFDKVEYMTYPRAIALAEVVWSQAEAKNYEDFKTRLAPQLFRMNIRGVNFRKPSPEGMGNRHIITKDTVLTILNPLEGVDTEIKYTIDGTEPTKTSQTYTEPLKISENIQIKANLVYPDGSVSKTGTSRYYFINPAKNGLNCAYFEGDWKLVPDFNTLTALKTGKVHDISSDALTEKDDKYGLRFYGKMQIDKTNEYNFYTASDDGSKLYIDNKLIVVNDGVHGAVMATGKVHLTEGLHDVKIDYFENVGGQFLEVGTISDNGRKVPLDPSKLFFE